MMSRTSAHRHTVRCAHNMIQWMEWCVLMELWLLHWVYIDLIASKAKYICNNNFNGLKSSLFLALIACALVLLMLSLSVRVFGAIGIVNSILHRHHRMWLKSNFAGCGRSIFHLEMFFKQLFFISFFCLYFSCFCPYWWFWTMMMVGWMDGCVLFFQIQCNLKQNWKISTFHTFYSFILYFIYLLFDSIICGRMKKGIDWDGEALCTHYDSSFNNCKMLADLDSGFVQII